MVVGGERGRRSSESSDARSCSVLRLRHHIEAGLVVIDGNLHDVTRLDVPPDDAVGEAALRRLLDPDARVARCLAELFNPLLYPGMGMRLTITQEEVGYLARVSRQRANQALRKLEEAGLLNVEYGAVRVLDLDGLKLYGSDRGALEGEHAA